MMLVDTSVWAEYFRSRPALSRGQLDALAAQIENDEVVTVLPIEAEVLSGRIAGAKERDIRAAFEAFEHVDLDWNARATWDAIIALAHASQRNSLPTLGVVDRMVLLAAESRRVSLWTLDRALARVAKARGVAAVDARSS